MKFVHIADMHFDTSFNQINDSELCIMRRLEQRKVLKKIIDYIKENQFQYLFIAGDLYEHKFIRQSTIDYINKLFKEIEDTKIFITPGNHDPIIKNSFYNKYLWNDNVYIFDSEISYVDDNDVRIYGYGFDDFYYTNNDIEGLELEDQNKVNILITHATLNGTNNIERQYNAVSRSTLERIGFDYAFLFGEKQWRDSTGRMLDTTRSYPTAKEMSRSKSRRSVEAGIRDFLSDCARSTGSR